MGLLIITIHTIVRILVLFIIAYVILGYFLDYYHPIRQNMAKVIEPLLSPIRNRLPSMGGLDLSPLILIIIVQVLGSLIIAVVRRF
jgi:YggT family protein